MNQHLLRWALPLVLLLAVALVAPHLHSDRSLESVRASYSGPQYRFVTAAGMQVHLREDAAPGVPQDRPAVVLLHGTSASLHTWDGWARELSKTHRVVRFDLAGFGLTGPHPRGDYSIAAYVEQVTAVLKALKLEKVILVGNSLGGEIAWNTALKEPGLVAQLVLVDAAGYAFVPESIPLGFRLARIPYVNKLLQYLTPRPVVAQSVRNVYGRPELVTEALIDRYFELTLREGNRAALGLRFAQMENGANAALVKSIKQPTLILWGGKDRLIPPRFAAEFLKDIAGSQLKLYPELGHVPHEEDPQTVRDVIAFISRS